jgi:hypothetical protein
MKLKLFVQQWLDEQPQTLFESGIKKMPQQWRLVYTVTGRIRRKIDITF